MFRLIFVALAMLTMPLAAAAQDAEQRAEDIVAVMQGEAIYVDVFDPVFTSQISEDTFSGITDQLEAQFGQLMGLESLEPQSATLANITIRFERGIASGVFQLATEAPHKVVGYRITGVEPVNNSAEDLLADIQALPGQASLLVTSLDGAEPLLAHDADRHFAIGSTFKLYVLSALAHQVATSERSWGDVVELSTLSFPSGMTQDWPRGAPVTLHTLATLMISISDNTATDQLIEVIGRDAVEAEVVASGHSDAGLMRPFMTTRELFVLKAGEDVGAYRDADLAGRRAALLALADAEPSDEAVMAAFTGGPNNIEVEWLASAHDIARLMRRLRDLEDPTAREIMAVNSAVPETMADDWQYAGYKGGSEPGVLNMSWLLQNHAGEWFAVSLSWNNPDAVVDLQTFNALAMRAIALAAGD